MNKEDLIKEINNIIASVPEELFKFEKPRYTLSTEWEAATPKEKAYLLIQDLMFSLNREALIEREKEIKSTVEFELGKCPHFYSNADENMFFNAIYAIPSYVKVIGNGNGLTLHCKCDICIEEVEFLINLLKRYQMDVPPELQQRFCKNI